MPEFLIMPMITCAFILVDIITGITQAFANHTVSSDKLREGAFHKMAYIIIMTLAYLIDLTTGYHDLGFDFPLLDPVCVYLIFTEIVSILENVCKLNPELRGSKIFNLFKNKTENIEIVEVEEDE